MRTLAFLLAALTLGFAPDAIAAHAHGRRHHRHHRPHHHRHHHR